MKCQLLEERRGRTSRRAGGGCLFGGKRVRPRLANDAPELLLKSASESAFELADAYGTKHFPLGGEYVVEIVERVRSLSREE